jgi:methenyltetrahydrofolate cyclohydrolase
VTFDAYIEAIAARTSAPGGGAVCASSAAIAAAVVEMAARFAEDDAAIGRAEGLRQRVLPLGERDATAYQAVLAAESPAARDEALSAAADPPLEVAEAAAEIAELGARLAVEGNPSLRGDAIAGVLVAEAGCRAAAELVRLNLAAHAEDPRIDAADAAAERAALARAGALAR